MKKLLTLSLLIASVSTYGQVVTDYTTRVGYKELRANGYFHLPTDTILSTSTNANPCQQIAKKDSLLYHYDCISGKWDQIGKAPDLSMLVKYTDTAAMLAPYLLEEDTIHLSNRINDKAPLSGGSGYIQNQFTAPQTGSSFWIDGVGQGNTFLGGLFQGNIVKGLTSLQLGDNWNIGLSGGGMLFNNSLSGASPLYLFGSSGVGIEGGLTLAGGNTSIDFGGTIAPRYLEFTNFVNTNQLGTTAHHFLMYDPVSSRAKYLPFATVSAGITKTLNDVVQANHTTVNDSIVIAPPTNIRAVFRARATGTQPATLYLNNGTNVVQIQAQSSNTGLTLSGNNSSIVSLMGTTSTAINFTNAPAQINFSGAASSQLVASPAGFDFRNSSLTQTMMVSNSGNVGIGTSTPATRLHVNSGHFMISGGVAPPTSGAGLAMWIAGSLAVIRNRDFTGGTDRDITIVGEDITLESQTGGSLRFNFNETSAIGNFSAQHINGYSYSSGFDPVAKTADFTISSSDLYDTYKLNNGGGTPIAVTLPTASTVPGREYKFKVTTGATGGSVTIAGLNVVLSGTTGPFCLIKSDGSIWYGLQGF